MTLKWKSQIFSVAISMTSNKLLSKYKIYHLAVINTLGKVPLDILILHSFSTE